MKLVLERKTYTEQSTVGELSIDGKFQCHTLEDVVRQDGVKVYGKTAIPSGAYDVTVTMSPKFGKLMPLVNDVPNYAGVRIHPGNDAEDTEGCILVGNTVAENFIGESRAAFAELYPLILDAKHKGEPVTLVIHDNIPAADQLAEATPAKPWAGKGKKA